MKASQQSVDRLCPRWDAETRGFRDLYIMSVPLDQDTHQVNYTIVYCMAVYKCTKWAIFSKVKFLIDSIFLNNSSVALTKYNNFDYKHYS